MSKVYNDVAVFMNSVGQTTNQDNPDQAALYKTLIKEEYKELMDAIENEPDDHILKEAFDLIWVVVGYVHSRGWNGNGSWDEGSKSNLSKIDPKTGFVRRRDDGKILKPEGWTQPDFTKFV